MSPTTTARWVRPPLGREQVVDPAQAGPAAGEQVPPLPGQHLVARCRPRPAASATSSRPSGRREVDVTSVTGDSALCCAPWDRGPRGGDPPGAAVGGGAPRGDPLDDGRAARPARPRGHAGRRRRGGAGRQPGAGLLPLRHQGRPGRRGVRARRRARPAPAGRRPPRGDDPVDRLRRVLRLYGPTGRATGWRIWIDAWALAQREPQHPQGAAAAGPPVAGHPARRGRRRRRRRRRSPAPTRRPPWPASRRWSTGSPSPRWSTARVTREQLRSWVAEPVARELGVDVGDACD